VFSDWPDGLWLYERGDDDQRDTRFFRAEGRGVGVEEGTVELEGGRTAFRAVGRRTAKLDRIVSEVVGIVAGNPDGVGTSEVKNGLSGANALKNQAVDRAVDLGFIRREDDPSDRRRKVLHPVSNGGLDV
jgi:hypothetical protein